VIKTKLKIREKYNKTLRKDKKWADFFDKKAIKENESKIKILEHELLVYTHFYLLLALL
jgi:hypothetical protein